MPRRRHIRKKRWPPLRKIDPNTPPERKTTPETIRKVLEPISSIHIEDVNSSESDIPDVFEDVHKESFFNSNKSGKKYITKYEVDILTMDQFTDLHKSIMKDLRDELKIGDNLLNETIEDIQKVIDTPKEEIPLLPETMESIAKTLSDPGVIAPSEEIQAESSETRCDYMSGIWKMLEEHCKGRKLTITPENYDAYNQAEPHWLERPTVPQEILDNSKTKCYKWLAGQYE